MAFNSLYVKKGFEQSIHEGHPWIYKNAINRIRGDFTPGDLVEIKDWRGKFLGIGYANPSSYIVARILTRKQEKIDESFWRKRLKSALNFRCKTGIAELDAYRIVFSEADFLPGVIIDKFGDYIVLQTLTLGVDRFKEIIVRVLIDLFPVKGIYHKNDVPVRAIEGLSQEDCLLFGEVPDEVIIEENSVKFCVNIAGGQKTGHFLDQRRNRALLKDISKGANVLDAFCYTGGFGLNAARFGAKSVFGVDVSEDAVATARRNAGLNGFDSVCRYDVANVFDRLRELESKGQRYDVIVLDPPAFAKNKRAVEGALRGYKEINLRAMKIVKEGGFLLTCSCSHHISWDLFEGVIFEAAKDAGKTLRVVAREGQPPDHPVLMGFDESRYLKCLLLEVS